MKSITEFTKKPQLQQVEINDEEIVKNYGESITFYMLDHVDISTYFDFFKAQADNNGEEINLMLRKIIKNAEGQPALAEDEMLPIDISIAALTKINEILGKSKTRTST